jgi:hypothetical protein
LIAKGKDKIEEGGHYLVVSKCGHEHASGGVEGVSRVVRKEEAGDFTTVRLYFRPEMSTGSCAFT